LGGKGERSVRPDSGWLFAWFGGLDLDNAIGHAFEFDDDRAWFACVDGVRFGGVEASGIGADRAFIVTDTARGGAVGASDVDGAEAWY